jgi:hypothetical protein
MNTVVQPLQQYSSKERAVCGTKQTGWLAEQSKWAVGLLSCYPARRHAVKSSPIAGRIDGCCNCAVRTFLGASEGGLGLAAMMNLFLETLTTDGIWLYERPVHCTLSAPQPVPHSAEPSSYQHFVRQRSLGNAIVGVAAHCRVQASRGLLRTICMC